MGNVSGPILITILPLMRVLYAVIVSFMGQLTLARFRGDTTFGLVARVFATFFGGIVGITIWCGF